MTVLGNNERLYEHVIEKYKAQHPSRQHCHSCSCALPSLLVSSMFQQNYSNNFKLNHIYEDDGEGDFNAMHTFVIAF